MMTNPSAALHKLLLLIFQIMLLVVPLTWTTSTSELFEFPKMLLVYAFTVLILTIWISRMIVERRLILRPTFLDIPILLFLTAQVLATVFSIDRHTSFYGYYSRFHGGLLSTLSYLVLYYAAVSNFSSKEAVKIIKTIIITGVIVCIYAFPEHYGHSPSCIRVANKFTADCWIQDVQTRVFGTFGQPNWLAAYLIAIFFLPMAEILNKISFRSKRVSNLEFGKWILYLGILLLFTSVLLFTKSRSGLAGLALGMVIFWPLVLYTLRHQFKRVLMAFALFAAVLTVGFLIFGKGAIPRIDTQITKILSPSNTESAPTAGLPAKVQSGTQLDVGGTESGTIRKIVWTGAINLWKMHPLFGSGVETFAYSYYNARPAAHNLVSEWDFLYNKAHNEFLNYLATTGLLGLLSYLILIFTYTVWSLKQIFNNSQQGLNSSRAQPDAFRQPSTRDGKPDASIFMAENKVQIVALLSGFWALMVSNFFGFSTVPVGLLFFLYPALAFLLTIKPSSHQAMNSLPLQTSQYISLALLFIVSCYLLLRVVNYYRADLAYSLGKNLTDTGDLGRSLSSLQKAYTLWPNEPTYTDAYSLAAAKAVLSLAANNKPDEAKPYADQAIALSNLTLSHNKVNLNFWKTRARIFLALATIDAKYVAPGEQALQQAARLAPTDAKIFFNLASLRYQLQDYETAKKLYQKTLELKPNYEAAKQDLDIILAIEATQSGKPQSP